MTQMSDRVQDDDTRLLGALADVLRGVEPAPPPVVAAAKSAFVWRTVDAELAALAYDSSHDDELTVGVRAATVVERTLVFQAGELGIEVDVTADALIGQVTPGAEGIVAVERLDGSVSRTGCDPVGSFSSRPRPEGMFRLRYTRKDGTPVVTQWVRR